MSALNLAETDPGLSLVIPLYNEEDSVAGTLERLKALEPHLPTPWEVILVDDGSTDGTAERLKELMPEDSPIKVRRHTSNRGYGAALKTGCRECRHGWIAIVDADGTYPIDRIPDLYRHATENDFNMVVGSRTGPNVVEPKLRRLPKLCLRILASSLSGTKIPDLNSGLRVFHRETLMKYLHILPDGFSFTTTITLAMLSRGLPIDFVPIDLFKREGRSKIRPIYDTLNFIQLICRTVLWLNPLRIFLPLGILFILSGITLLLVSWMAFSMPLDMSSGLLIQTGVIVLAVGMLADLIDKRSP